MIPTQITYTSIDNIVVATHTGNQHTLVWRRDTGDTFYDQQPLPVGYHLSERAWHLIAADLFHVPRDTERDDAPPVHQPRGVRPLVCHDRGAGWGIACSCGHYRTGWCATEFEARQRYGGHLIASGVVPQQRSATS